MQVAKTTVAALGQQHPDIRVQQLGEHFVSLEITNDGAYRHAQHDVIGCSTELVRATPGLTVARLVTARITVIDQRVDVAVGHRENTAATTAITAIGSAERDELLAPKAHAARTAGTGGDVDGGFVNEFHAAQPLGPMASITQKPRQAGA